MSRVDLRAVCALLLATGCAADDAVDELVDLDNDARVIGQVQGLVIDHATHEPLAGVEVHYVKDDRPGATVTDGNGFYWLSGLHQGTWELRFEVPAAAEERAPAYAGAAVDVVVPTLEEIGLVDVPTEEPFYHNIEREVRLYGLTASLDGQVLSTLEAQGGGDPLTGQPAEGVELVLDVVPDQTDYRVLFDQARATSDGAGEFSLVALPATPTATLRALPFSDGTYSYAEAVETVGLVADSTTSAGTVWVFSDAAGPVITADNFIGASDFAVGDNLTLTLSKEVEVDGFDVDLWRLNGPGGATVEELQADVSWAGGTSLTVDPYLVLQLGSTYRLDLSGWTVDGAHYDVGLEFDTEALIELLESNVQRADGSDVLDFAIDDDLTLTFSRSVDDANPDNDFALYEEGVLVYTTVSVAAATVTVDPEYALEPGTEYRLDWTAHSAIAGDVASGSIDFESASGAGAPGVVSGLALDPGDLPVDWDTTTLPLRWDSVPGAGGYEVYARDDYQNTSLVLVADVPHQDWLSYQQGAVPAQFDAYAGDGIQTPFTANTVVTFNVIATNAAGAGPLMAPAFELLTADNVAPEGGAFTSQSESADNTTSFVPLTLEVTFVAPEYCDPTSGDANVTAFGVSTVVEWNPAADGGTVFVTVPAGQSAVGASMVLEIKDTRGNQADLANAWTFF